MYKYIVSKRSKLKNFAPKILLCAERRVLSIRNANIVFGRTTEECENNLSPVEIHFLENFEREQKRLIGGEMKK
ncbi:hypothetical protein CHL74_12500 [Prevotella sp. 885]|nr:hypothetical protein CHL74_12500 [Prevotella sp. 885]